MEMFRSKLIDKVSFRQLGAYCVGKVEHFAGTETRAVDTPVTLSGL
jgi:hypothetical protein